MWISELVTVEFILDLIDAHEPVFSGVSLLQVSQTNVLVANLSIPCTIVACRRPEVQLNTNHMPCNIIMLVIAFC